MSRALVIAAALALASAACRDARLEQLQAIRGEVCACKTVACGEAAIKRLPRGEDKANHRERKVAKAMVECLAKLYANARPSAGPDAEEPEDGAAAGSADPAALGTP